jgi:hypothetical protein
MNEEQKNFLSPIDGAAKFFRRFFERGVSLGALMSVVNHDESLDVVAEWIKRGKPKLTYVDGQKEAVADMATTEPEKPEKSDPRQGFLMVVKEPLAQAINSRHDSAITENRFAITDDQVGEWEFKVFDSDRDISTGDALDEMKNEGFFPPQSGPSLAYAKLHPEEQRKRPIVCLGAVAVLHDRLSVFVLVEYDGERFLDLYWCDGGWRRRDLFLGVRRRRALSGA